MQVQGDFTKKVEGARLMTGMEMTKYILKKEGIPGMFKGLTVNFFKVIEIF